MNLDDESLLSAFFDDEIDPGERAAVAGLVDSSPELAGLLADFGGLRAALRSLDRPSVPVDLAPLLLGRLAAAELTLGTATATATPALADEGASELEVIALPQPPAPPRPRRRHRLAQAARVAASLVGVGSVAASLLYAMVLLFHPLHNQTDTPSTTTALPGLTAQVRPHPSSSESASSPSPSSPTVPEVVALPPVAARAPVAAEGSAPGSRWAEAARPVLTDKPVLALRPAAKAKEELDLFTQGEGRPAALGRMLEQGRIVRVGVTTNAPDQAATRVRQIVEQDPHREAEFGRISLPANLVVDPSHPGPAEVFAVVVRQGDGRSLVDRLRDEFPGAVVAEPAAPELVLHLTEVGDAAVLARTPPAELGPMPNGLRRQLATREAVRPAEHFPGDGPALLDREQVQNQPLGATDLPLAKSGGNVLSKPASPAPEPVTVLIWITRSAAR